MASLRALIPALALVAFGLDATALPCATDTPPAATLLIPWFEVDVANCNDYDPDGVRLADTTFTILNPAAPPLLARVTLWSDLALPVFDFEIYLPGWAEETVSLARVLCRGYLPSTGPGVQSAGGFSDPLTNFPGCNGGANPLNGPPVYGGDGALTAQDRSNLVARLTGTMDGTGQCFSSGQGDGRAVGYITIDTVNSCSPLTHADRDYFTNVLTPLNRLVGSFTLRRFEDNASVSLPAVALESGPMSLFGSGEASFYGGLAPVSDGNGREPLPTTYQAPFDLGGSLDDTELIVWREAGPGLAPMLCGFLPAWYPLGHSNRTGYLGSAFFVIDPLGVASTTATRTPFPLATQRVSFGETFPDVTLERGTLWVNLQHRDATGDGENPHGQGWVGVLLRDRSRYTDGFAAPPVDDGCTAPGIEVDPGGPDGWPGPGTAKGGAR